MLDSLDTLSTNRLCLKAFTPEVYRQAFTLLPETEIRSLFGHQNDEAFLLEKERFENGMTTFNKGFLFFQLRDRSTNIFLGWCGYHTWYYTHKRAEVFYMLHDEQQRRQGFMTEALAAVLTYGFTTMELERVEAFVGVDNTASNAILKRFGFKQEGLFRKHYRVNGVNGDSLAYGLLKEEFEALPTSIL
jgi:ribosomal-protein-alanine N-acetyltransferase